MNYTHRFAIKKMEELLPLEKQYDILLDKEKYYIIRFDGIRMTKNFLGKQEIKNTFLYTMKETLKIFMEQHPKLKFSYTFSDEISILLEEEYLQQYDYRLEKLLTVFTSQLTSAFYLASGKTNLSLDDKIRGFDGRIICLNEFSDIVNYYISRQVIQISCHFLRLKREYLPNIRTTHTNKLISALKAKGIEYDSISKSERYGLIWINNGYHAPYEFQANPQRLQYQIENRGTIDTVQYFKKIRKTKVVKKNV